MFSVKIRYSFIIFAVISVLFLDTKVILYALISMTLHEVAHILSAGIFGCETRSLELCAQGFTIDFQSKPSGLQNMIIILSGPLINLILAAICMTVSHDRSSMFLTFNLSFGLFNLIPLRFLDGGRLLEELLDICLSAHLAARICSTVNVILLCITWCLSIYCFLFENTHSSSLFICIFTLINLCLDDSF